VGGGPAAIPATERSAPGRAPGSGGWGESPGSRGDDHDKPGRGGGRQQDRGRSRNKTDPGRTTGRGGGGKRGWCVGGCKTHNYPVARPRYLIVSALFMRHALGIMRSAPARSRALLPSVPPRSLCCRSRRGPWARVYRLLRAALFFLTVYAVASLSEGPTPSCRSQRPHHRSRRSPCRDRQRSVPISARCMPKQAPRLPISARFGKIQEQHPPARGARKGGDLQCTGRTGDAGRAARKRGRAASSATDPSPLIRRPP
jgi:hypothetical protein